MHSTKWGYADSNPIRCTNGESPQTVHVTARMARLFFILRLFPHMEMNMFYSCITSLT